MHEPPPPETPPPARWRPWVAPILRVSTGAGLGWICLGPPWQVLQASPQASPLGHPALLGAGWALALHAAERASLARRLGLAERVAIGSGLGAVLGLVLLVVAHAPLGLEAWRSLAWLADPTRSCAVRAFDALERRLPLCLGILTAGLLALSAWPRARTWVALVGSPLVGVLFAAWALGPASESAAPTINYPCCGCDPPGLGATWALVLTLSVLPGAWSLAGLGSGPPPQARTRGLPGLALRVGACLALLVIVWRSPALLRDGLDSISGWSRTETRAQLYPRLYQAGPGCRRDREPGWLAQATRSGLESLQAGRLAEAEHELTRVAAAWAPATPADADDAMLELALTSAIVGQGGARGPEAELHARRAVAILARSPAGAELVLRLAAESILRLALWRGGPLGDDIAVLAALGPMADDSRMLLRAIELGPLAEGDGLLDASWSSRMLCLQWAAGSDETQELCWGARDDQGGRTVRALAHYRRASRGFDPERLLIPCDARPELGWCTTVAGEALAAAWALRRAERLEAAPR